MYIVRFQGGLGNQMFQACFLWMLELLYPQKKVLADLTPYRRYAYHHGYEIKKIFNISLPEASSKELMVATCFESCFGGSLLKVWRKVFSVRKKNHNELREDTSSSKVRDMFYADLFPLKEDNLYLNGVWVWGFNEAYQLDHPAIIHAWRKKIKQEFVFPGEVYLEQEALIKDMQKRESVSVHLRRGDYVGTNFDVCTQSYYEAARSYMEEKLDHPTYYVFSDDMSYAKECFQHWDTVEFIDGHYGDDAWKDMFLMSQCRHHIIANSTFSFWGAYLGKSDSLVIAPKEYYRNEKGFCLAKKEWITL